jgi:hypothetical protein
MVVRPYLCLRRLQVSTDGVTPKHVVRACNASPKFHRCDICFIVYNVMAQTMIFSRSNLAQSR